MLNAAKDNSLVALGTVADEARPRTASPSRPPSAAPLPVIRGAKCQVEGTIDWFRAAAADCQLLDAVIWRLSDCFGSWQPSRGRHSYDLGYKYPCGAEVWYSTDGGMCVDLPGDALGMLVWTDKVQLLKWLLFHGLHCTRIDVALDYRGEGITIIADARRAAEAGELCRSRTWKPQDEFSSGERTAYGVNFGKRGKDGSGRYIRIYDKGLETGECSIGQWVRWEAEFSKDSAASAALMILNSQIPEQHLRPLALGCVDFRENTGDAHLERRPRLQWFTDLLEDQSPVRASAPRRTSRLDSYAGWIRRSAYPTLAAMASLADCSVADVVGDLTGDLRSKKDPHLNAVACEYADLLALNAGLAV